MKFLTSLLIFCAPAFGANCVTAGTCPAECPGTAGSLTFSAIPNTAYTSPAGTTIASTDCLYSIPYDSGVTCAADHAVHFPPVACIVGVFEPHGVANPSLFWIVCYHGGGGYGGNAEACFGGGNTTITPIKLIQQYLDTPNPVGGKGIGIIEVEYNLSTAPGTATFPQQFRDVACSISLTEAGGMLGFAPPMLGYYGPSWGGTLSFWAGNVPTSVYGADPNCLNTDARPAQSRTVSAWAPMTWMQPNGVSFWENSPGSDTEATGHEAMENALNCSSQPICYSSDIALNATPYLQINSGSLAQIRANAQMFQWTEPDTLVKPYYSPVTAGAAPYTVAAYQALGVTPVVLLYPDGPSFLNNVSTDSGHELGLGNVGFGPMGDAFTFLMGTASVNIGGNIGGGIF